MRVLAGLAAAVSLATGAAAQPLADPEATLVRELVVQAVEPGPAWWRVKDADTTVWILGLSGDDLPKDLAWDRRALERRMAGANTLVFGARVGLSAGLRDVPALLRARSALRSKTPLEETLPEPLRRRFTAARERIGQPAKRYASWTPLIAGQMLVGDGRDRNATASVSAAILKTAKAHKVKPVYPASYPAMPVFKAAMASLTPQVHERCLEEALRDAEAPPARTRAAAEGWARGDVAAAVSEPRSFEKCLLLLGGGADLWRRAVADQAAAIAKALETPGHAVAVVSLRPLLAEGGVVETLEARGLDVLGPGEAG